MKKPDPPKRHLAFHIMPRMANDVWRRALDQLRLRWNLFDGIKVIAVVQGDGLEPASEIEEYVRGWGAEILQAPNDARLREVVTWDGLMSKVFAAANPQDFVFYAHAKGVTREIASTCMTHRWASLQYSLGLDYWPEIEALLKRRAIVGSFKKNGIAFGPQYGRWHYSGTFFWANVGILKYKLGQVPMPEYVYGVEAWPGMAFDVPEGGCLFHEHPKSKLDLYNPHHWHQSVMPELRTWLMTNPRRNAVESRSGGGSNEVG